MAKRKPFANDNIQVMEHQAFRVDDTTKEYWKAVIDEEGNALLEQIRDALGGSSVISIETENISTVSNTTVAYTFLADCAGVVIKTRNGKGFKISSNVSLTNYLTVPPGANYSTNGLLTGTIYIQTSDNNVLEIISKIKQ